MKALPLIAVFGIGGWGVILLLAIILILLGAKHLPLMAKGLGEGISNFKRASDEFGEFKKPVEGILHELERDPHFHQPDYRGETHQRDRGMNGSLILFVAQGFGIGRVPKAPGTFGTLLGFAWFAVMIAITGAINRGIVPYLVLLIASIFVSVWFCGRAEKILGTKDPGSVVLDEIVAIPVCYLPWLLNVLQHSPHHHAFVRDFFNSRVILGSVLIFIGFRVFDIWKPWPIRRLQDLPGGWGVTIDDLLAAIYVALISSPFVS